MKFEISFRNLDAMTLAFLFNPDEDKANGLLDEFLLANNVINSRRFRMEMAVTQRGVKYVTFIKYAQVPEGTNKRNTISIVDLPKAEYLYFQISEEQYANFNDEESKVDISTFMKEHHLEYDISKVIALVEEKLIENKKVFDIYFPFKRKMN